jgi:membrane protein YqaA with SNARE-associated domain
MILAWQAAKKAAGGGAVSHARRSPLLRWFINLGGLGLFVVAIADSSMIPLPVPGSTDLLLLVLAIQERTSPWMVAWLAFCAFAGSVVGGYFTWSAGKKGGEVAMDRYISRRFRKRIAALVEKHGVWSVAVATILPPPVPLTPFLLAAGALKMERNKFMVSYSLGRAVRYGLVAWLSMTYGRTFSRLWEKELSGWSGPVLWTYGGLVLVGLCYGLWKFFHRQRNAAQAEAPAEGAA